MEAKTPEERKGGIQKSRETSSGKVEEASTPEERHRKTTEVKRDGGGRW